MTTPLTRHKVAAALEEQGITGAAADLILRAGAPARHEARVQDRKSVV